MKSLFLVFFLFVSLAAVNSQAITYRNNIFRVEPLPKLSNDPKSKVKWGLYFWEFGNGHYKITSEPEVPYSGYSRNGYQDVKVQLVPHYTVVKKPVVIRTTIPISKGFEKADYKMDKQLVHIESSANGEAVPGHDIRVAIHYKAPASQAISNGHLIFFYNNTEEKEKSNISFDPFTNKKEYGFHYGEKALDNADLKNSDKGSDAFDRLKNENDGFVIIKTSKMSAGEERRVFLTVHANNELKKITGSQEKDLTFTAIWIPGTGEYDSQFNEVQYSMKILKVHDPNNMKVKPNVAYYRKGKPQTFSYRINLQNEEKGIAQDAKISVFLGQGLEKDSLKVKNYSAVSNKLSWNPNCSQAERENGERCFEVVPSSYPDSIFFYFHNIDLPGPKFFNRRRSKGHIEFTIVSNEKAAITKSRASISLNETKPELTNWAKIKWRQKGLFLRTGMNFNVNPSDYLSVNDQITDQLAIGLWVQNAPVGTGFSRGISLDYFSSRIKRDSEIVAIASIIPSGGLLTESENIKLNLAEVQAHVGFQLKGFLKIYATSGVSLPIASKFELGAKVQNNLSDAPVIEDKITGFFGLFGGAADPVIFNKSITTRAFLGYVGSIGVELGALNSFVFGLKSEYRYYNQFYYTGQGCYSMANMQAYLRLKLFTL